MASIDIDNASVHFILPELRANSLRSALGRLSLGGVIGRGTGGLGVTAIDDISVHLKEGDRLGLIGHNGAGKTTLLKVLAAILPPTQGRVRIEGRISALLSIQLGLDAEVSGYDNIRSRARHMGRTEAEIDASFDEIAAFSELGEYLNLPMKTYSSGMRLRLAFAIATAFEPEILVLDEWLSAGDAQFQKKASQRLRELIARSGIFAFASHNTSMQRSLCNKGLVLVHGKIGFYGDIGDALDYAEQLEAARSVAASM